MKKVLNGGQLSLNHTHHGTPIPIIKRRGRRRRRKKENVVVVCCRHTQKRQLKRTQLLSYTSPRNPTGLKMCDTIPNKLKISSLTLEMSLNRIITKYYTVVKEELNLDCCIRVDARRLSKHATAIKYPPVKVEKHQPTLCNNNNRKNEKKRFFLKRQITYDNKKLEKMRVVVVV